MEIEARMEQFNEEESGTTTRIEYPDLCIPKQLLNNLPPPRQHTIAIYAYLKPAST